MSHVKALQGWHQRWDCVWCGQPNTGFSQYRDPATATIAELAADVASHGLAFRPLGREEDGGTQPMPLTGGSEVQAAPPPVTKAAAPTSRRLLWPIAATVVAVVTGVAIAAGLPAAKRALPGVPAGVTRSVSVAAGPVAEVDLQGVPGELTITGSGDGRVTLTGRLRWTGKAPAVIARLDRPAGVLHLIYRCAAASPCTENYRLAVPAGTTTFLRQPSGHVTVTGLSGPLHITAGNVDVSATGMRSPVLAAAITSGRLSASFAAAPWRLSLLLTSAQAVLRLPGSTTYQVSQRIIAGDIGLAIPQASSAQHTVTVEIHSGEAELLSS